MNRSKTAVIMLSVSILVSFLIVASNLATILTFLINRPLRRRSVYCLIHLASVDMTYGVLRIVRDLYEHMFYFRSDWSTSVVVLNVTENLVDINVVTCLLSLVLVSLERVYATYFPFRYRTTRARTYFVVFAITWLIPVAFNGPYLKEKGTSSFGVILITGFLVLSVVALITICISYTAIFVKVRTQAKRLQPNRLPTALRRTRKQEQHLGMTLFIVTILSLIAWLPMITLTFLYVQRAVIMKLSFAGYKMIFLVHLTNSLINPIVYVIRMKDFRKAIVQMVFRCSRASQRPLVVRYCKNGEIKDPVVELGIGWKVFRQHHSTKRVLFSFPWRRKISKSIDTDEKPQPPPPAPPLPNNNSYNKIAAARTPKKATYTYSHLENASGLEKARKGQTRIELELGFFLSEIPRSGFWKVHFEKGSRGKLRFLSRKWTNL